MFVLVVENRTTTVRSCTKRRQMIVALLCAFLPVSVVVAQQGQVKISGVVSDSAGASISQASVEFETNGGDVLQTRTTDRGEFVLLSKSAIGVLKIQAPGFTPVTIKLDGARSQEQLQVRLEPAPLLERILVNADDEHIPPTATSEYAIGKRAIALSGALTIDDVLRQVPGFSLFRRSGSLTANPTSQGVSLRGVGANGASRAVVLVDGIPLNSPFGGWVYWNRLPRTSIENVQIYNGGTSDLYGSGALGGVINIKSSTAPATFFDVEASAGNEGTAATSFSGGKTFGKWGVLFSGQALRTGGYVLVPEDQRGFVDTPAGTGDLAGSLTLSRTFGSQGHAFA